MVDVISILGFVVGALGTGFGVYSGYERRRDKKRRERLKELSDKLNDIRSRMERVRLLNEPYSHPDLSHSLNGLSHSLIAHEFETGETPHVTISVRADGDGLESAEQALQVYKERYTFVSAYASIRSYEGPSFGIDEHMLYFGTVYKQIDEVREDYLDIIEEFSPGLLSNLESSLDNVVRNSFHQAIGTNEAVAVDIRQFESTDKIGKFVYDKFWHYDGVQDDIDEIENLIDEIEENRIAILQASYA